MPDLAYVNGEIMPIESAVVPIEDRGYQFGDGVYEFVASYEGRLFMLEAHLDRLERSMSELAYDPISRSAIKQNILDLLAASGYKRAGIYIQISRGVAPRNHAFAKGMSPQVIMTIRRVNEMPAPLRENGAKAITVTDLRWGRCDTKTIQLLPNCLAKQQAIEAGCDDAILINDRGIVREGTSSNLFIVSEKGLTTHPLTPHILPGITRKVVLDICKEAGMEATESFFDTDALFAAEEVFLTGTVTEVLPIVLVDGKTIGNGSVGPVAKRLYALLRKKAEALSENAPA